MAQTKHRVLLSSLVRLSLTQTMDPRSRLPCVNTIVIPAGVDGAALSGFAMSKYNLEIAGGLGPTMGKCWRVGVMGYNARPMNVNLVVTAFKEGLAAQGWKK
jgi:alanine-glyoxylate transaminase/serine-glyoxylate transaminase/serine-pyruvate transaminase